MIEPVQRERVEAALKAAMAEAGLTAAELGRRLGKGATWVASVLQRIRQGNALTYETVRIIRTEIENVEEHLKAAGWWAGSSKPGGHGVPATRSTEHLRLLRHNLVLKRDDIDREIAQLDEQIRTLEEIASGR